MSLSLFMWSRAQTGSAEDSPGLVLSPLCRNLWALIDQFPQCTLSPTGRNSQGVGGLRVGVGVGVHRLIANRRVLPGCKSGHEEVWGGVGGGVERCEGGDVGYVARDPWATLFRFISFVSFLKPVCVCKSSHSQPARAGGVESNTTEQATDRMTHSAQWVTCLYQQVVLQDVSHQWFSTHWRHA